MHISQEMQLYCIIKKGSFGKKILPFSFSYTENGFPQTLLVDLIWKEYETSLSLSLSLIMKTGVWRTKFKGIPKGVGRIFFIENFLVPIAKAEVH